MDRTHSKLFWLSVLILYLELLLIRWIGTEVRIFAYLQNTILVICFLGLGMGCLSSARGKQVLHCLLPLAFICLILVIPPVLNEFQNISDRLSVFSDLLIWYKGATVNFEAMLLQVGIGLTLTFVLMLFIWDCFLPLGRRLGALFDESNNTIKAYSCNIAGSLVGVLVFSVAGYLSLPPPIWGYFLCFLVLIALGDDLKTHRRHLLTLAVILLCFYCSSGSLKGGKTYWTPYQKLELSAYDGSPNAKILWVNNVGYQLLLDLSSKNITSHPDTFDVSLDQLSHYDLPFRMYADAPKVLIVGAGTGTDVAAALRGGAKEVVAVDIDPKIIEIGKKNHPEQPYDSEKVRVVVDDARAFLNQTSEKFDLVVFGLLDAHTSTALTNVRLDHYVYTKESLLAAKAALKEGGLLVLSFAMQKPFILDRFTTMFNEVFGQDAILIDSYPNKDAHGWGGAMFINGDLQALYKRTAEDTAFSTLLEKQAINHQQKSSTIITDDWPYLYLVDKRIPVLHWILAGLLLMLYLWRRKTESLESALGVWRKRELHFFALGAAFLLLEVFTISRVALVLGNTWAVNSAIISAFMIMILLANTLTAYLNLGSKQWVYWALIASCVFLFFFDLTTLIALPRVLRWVVTSTIVSIPVFFSALIFMSSLDSTEDKPRALGVNLFGSLLGGLLQSLSFILGLSALMLIVTSFYLIALVSRPRLLGSTT